MRQSPRGESATEPTFGPSGITGRLNWLPKRRSMSTRSQWQIVPASQRPAKACSATNRTSAVRSAIAPSALVRVRLNLDYLALKELLDWLRHALAQAGKPQFMTPS
jgi:hypothetical protein